MRLANVLYCASIVEYGEPGYLVVVVAFCKLHKLQRLAILLHSKLGDLNVGVFWS